jgi:hypothetical protein
LWDEDRTEDSLGYELIDLIFDDDIDQIEAIRHINMKRL